MAKALASWLIGFGRGFNKTKLVLGRMRAPLTARSRPCRDCGRGQPIEIDHGSHGGARRFETDIEHRGVIQASARLRPTSDATTVQVRDGKILISDGPFAETTEQIGGYCPIDGKDLDEATEVASQLPGAQTGTIEVRPIWELGVDHAPIEIAKETIVATKAHTSTGIVLALSCAAQFMPVLDSYEVAMRKLAQTTFVTQGGVIGDRLSSTPPHASPEYRRTHP